MRTKKIKSNAFDLQMLKNPAVFQIRCLPDVSDHRYYRDLREADEEESSYICSLNGLWKFHYAKNPTQFIADFAKDDVDTKSWDVIRVPAHIQMEGYDMPQYVNIQYPWEGHEDIRPGQIPTDFNPVASYVKYFQLPETVKDEEVNICFEGVESAIALWLNGEFVGYHEDSFTPARFALTPYLRKGENKLAAAVFKFSSGSWCEDQDFFRFSGIFRDVYLYFVPKFHIDDMKIIAKPKKNLKSAKLSLDFSYRGCGKVSIRLKAPNGEIVLEDEKRFRPDVRMSLEYSVRNVKLWNEYTPHLYTLELILTDSERKISEVIREKVGFRRFELINNIMHLNGKRIVFKGVNRHEFSSKTGRAICAEDTLKDILTMKRNNINAIRTSHYPNQSHLYRLCDQYGLYVIDETNMETHGTWDTLAMTKDEEYALPRDKKEWQPMLLARAKSMYERDKNHACILMWSCGNESSGGSVIFEMSEYFRSRDENRLVHYEGIFHDRRYPATSDVESQMYTKVEDIKAFLKEHREKPFICCEYSHAMGNSCGGMFKYTDLTKTEPLYQGGFIWDYIDQSITRKNRYGETFEAYGGAFCDVPSDYNFSGNGIVYGKDREISPKMQEVKHLYQWFDFEFFDRKLKITNHHPFAASSDFDCVLTLSREGRILEEMRLDTDVKPFCSASYELSFCTDMSVGEFCTDVSMRLKTDAEFAKAGHEIAYAQHITGSGKLLYRGYDLRGSMNKSDLILVQSPHVIGVKNDEFEVLFSTLYGGMVGYRYGGRELLCAIPRPNFWRAPTDNDRGNQMAFRYAKWKTAGSYQSGADASAGEIMRPKVERIGESIRISFTHFLQYRENGMVKQEYTVMPDGMIEVKLVTKEAEMLGDMPEFGMLFTVDADYEFMRYYGLGPEENYSDRKCGARLGVYEKKVSDNLSAYLKPQECGNREGVRYAAVVDERKRGLFFKAKDGESMSFSALHYSPEMLEEAKYAHELPRVQHTFIRVSKARMGVGGDDSWGARTHDEFLLPSTGRLEFTFYFRGI